MKVVIRNEAGFEEAMYGLSLSFRPREIEFNEWWTKERFDRMKKVSVKLKDKGADHAKFLRQMMIWVEVEAPRYFWSEFDTYKIGTVAQSESTMHTLSKRDLTQAD